MLTDFPIQKNSRQIRYADPAIGGGKTHSLTNHVAHPFMGRSIIGIQSIELAKEIEASLKSHNMAVLRIDTDAFPYDPENPTVTCTSVLNDALKSGLYQALICNHEVALRAEEPYSRDYELFMDEVPPIHQRHWIDGVVLSHHTISSYITSNQAKAEGWRKIHITDPGEKFLEANHLEQVMKADKKLYEAIQKVADEEHFDVYAEEKPYRAFRDGLEESIVLHAIMKPAVFDKFAAVTVLGANFLSSLMYQIWSKFYGVEFSHHREIMTIGEDGIRYQDLKHKAPTTTVYYLSEKNCSKYTYKEVEYQPVFDATHDAFKALLRQTGLPDDTKHLVFVNNKPKDVKKKFYWKDEANATLLSPAVKGLDAYKEIDVAIFLAACNENKDTYHLLNALFDLNSRDIDRATALERAYQAVGRCSLRDMDSNRPVHLIFFEYRAAKHVADLIGCGEPVFLDTGLKGLEVKPKQTATEKEKKRYHRKNVKTLQSLDDYEGFNRRVWKNEKCHNPKDNAVHTWLEYVVTAYKQATTYRPESKEQAYFYREGNFKTLHNHKIKGNILSSKVITLDFDKVSGDPIELSEWLKARNISHVIFNSNGSRPEAPRFRMDIPLDRPVNAYAYGHIADWLILEIQAEFGSNAFIDDEGKRHIHAKFYVPGLSEAGGDFFIDGTVTDGEEPVFLDVMAYMDRDPVADEEPVIETKPNTAIARIGAMSIEQVIDNYSVPAGMGMGSRNFHQAGIDLLFKIGLSREEAIETLHANRYRFGNGNDRDAAYVIDHILQHRVNRAA